MRLSAFALLLALAGPALALDKTAINNAVDRGVAALRKSQQPGGTWNHAEIGPTALAGLTLVECGVGKEDRAVVAAANAVRKAAMTSTHTYSLSLAVLFLDKLDDPNDTPLVESLIIRLLAGQTSGGGWTYSCPGIGADEIRRIRNEMDGTRVLRAGGSLAKLPAKGKRSTDDLPKEIKDQLAAIAKLVPAMGTQGDNSNTQFATLALWVGRRYGIPTQGALLKVGQRFRLSQHAGDGGWDYTCPEPVGPSPGNSSPTMTCAGLLALACSQGAGFDVKKLKDPKLEKMDISKDVSLNVGLTVIAGSVGRPVGWDGLDGKPIGVMPASGKAYYFLWSLARVCLILNLETLAKKDWYNWGAEILVANQKPDGTWAGEYTEGNADTCFALLFLKKANFAQDLTRTLSGLKGHSIVLKAGGVGGGALKEAKPDLRNIGLGEKAKAKVTPEKTKVIERTAEQKAAAKLGDDAVAKKGEERSAVLKQLRETKGVAYTEALVDAIGRLDAEGRKEARHALAQRLTRMKDTTLREYLKDEEPEIRRAAALAVSARGSKPLTRDLVELLKDREPLVQRAAQAALKELTGKDLGTSAAAWEKWLKESSRE